LFIFTLIFPISVVVREFSDIYALFGFVASPNGLRSWRKAGRS